MRGGDSLSRGDSQKHDGITVGGVPLCDFLKKKEEEDKNQFAEEAVDQAKMDIAIIKKGRGIKTRAQYAEDIYSTQRGTPRVSKRVKRYSPEEIRKEYGIKMKPTGSKGKDTWWVLKEKGTVTVDDVVESTGATRASAGTMLWRLTKAFPDDITKDPVAQPNTWTISPNLRRKDVDDLHEMYLQYQRSLYKPKGKKERPQRLKPRKEEPTTAPPEAPPVEEKEEIEIDFEAGDRLYTAMVNAVVRKLSEKGLSVASEPLTVNINVTLGFKWIRS
jgi:hypothetical protein